MPGRRSERRRHRRTLAGGRVEADSLSDHGVQIDLRSRVGVDAPLNVVFGEVAHPDPVRDGVVDLPQQCAPSALEAVDDEELPQRPGPVEGVLMELLHEVEQGAGGAGSTEADPTDVVGEVELGIRSPHRRRPPAECRHNTLREAGHLGNRERDPPFEVDGVDHTVADHDDPAIGVQPRVLLDVPHQRLGV